MFSTFSNIVLLFFFVTGEDYIWGTGKVGVKCKGKEILFIKNVDRLAKQTA